MSDILDKCLPGATGRELTFTAGVEVGKAKGRQEFAEHLISKFRRLPRDEPLNFSAFVGGELARFQRGEV